MKKSTLLVAAFAVVLLTQKLQAQLFTGGMPIDPHREWKKLETAHFEVIYESQQKKLALKIAAEAERAHLLLAPLMKTEVIGKTIVVIADITDSSNGMATPLPYNTITLYPTLPPVSSSVDEYYDWPRELITHEYTHIQNFQPTIGIMDVGHQIFGNIFRPNNFLPRWYAEGLAVEMESRLTPLGRGRSSYYGGLDRSFFEVGYWGQFGVDEINSTSTPTWPRGQRPYYLGFNLVHYMSQKSNHQNVPPNEVYAYLNERYGGRFPYFINEPVVDLFGKDYSELFSELQENKKLELQSQWDQLKTGGAQNGEPFAHNGYSMFGPQISPDGLKLAAIVTDFNSDPAIKVWTRKFKTASFNQKGVEPTVVTTGKEIHQISWRADSQTIVFDHIQTVNHFSNYNDLFEINIAPHSEEKELTHGLRAREATVLPDGSIVFIIGGATQTSLAKMDSQGKNTQILVRAPDGERLSSPRAYQDNVIYSHRDAKGHEWIESYHFRTGDVLRLTQPGKIGEGNVTPSSFKNGFIFASNHTGVFNIYRHENGNTTPVTNVTTYATNPTYDAGANEVIYSRLTKDGFVLETYPVHAGFAPKVTPANVYKFPAAEETEAPAASLAADEQDYHGLSYLFPHYWYPWITLVPGGVLFDAVTESMDPLNHHQYFVDLGYDTRAQSLKEALSYTNSTTGIPINGSFINDYEYLAGFASTEQIIFGQVSASFSLQSDENKWSLTPSFTYKMTSYPGLLLTEIGPSLFLSYNNVTKQKDYQISPESGYDFGVGINYSSPLGNTSYQSLYATGDYYFSGKPLPDRNVLKVKGSAWVSPPQTIFTGTQQAGGEYGGLVTYQQFVVRGYSYGVFLGNTMFNLNLEYRFPLGYTYGGSGTFPVFTKAWYANIVTDFITLNGLYFDSKSLAPRNTSLGTFYMGSGAELKGDFQVLYGWDITVKAGVYYGFTTNAFGGFNYLLGMSTPL